MTDPGAGEESTEGFYDSYKVDPPKGVVEVNYCGKTVRARYGHESKTWWLADGESNIELSGCHWWRPIPEERAGREATRPKPQGCKTQLRSSVSGPTLSTEGRGRHRLVLILRQDP